MKKQVRPRILLQVNKLAAYRVPIYNLLSENVDLDVAYFEELGRIDGVKFEKILGKKISIGPFKYNKFSGNLNQYDAIISIFDARNLNTYIYAVLYPSKTILYAIGYGRSLIAAMVRRVFHQFCAATLVYTKSSAQQLISTGVPGSKVFFTGNTVKVRSHSASARRYFLYIGSPKLRKRVEDAIEALGIIKDQLPKGIGMLIAGPGVEEIYRPICIIHGVDDLVEFHDEVRDETKIAKIFAQSIALVSGQVGLSAPQALGHGVPVVTRADVAHGPEQECVIDGYTGRTYRSCDQLAEILLELSLQPEIAEKMGRNGLSLYENALTAEAMRDRMLEAIYYVLSGQFKGEINQRASTK